MCILLVTHYFPPGTGAPQARLSALARAWAAAGDTVTVLTGMPNHPTGVIPPEYRPLVTEPTVIDPAVARVDATPEEIAAADIVVLLTDHDAFLAADVGRHSRHVLDCRRVLSGPNVETL